MNDIQALIAEARAWEDDEASWGDNGLVTRLRDALEAAHAEPDEDEREALRQRLTNNLLKAFPQWGDEMHAVSDWAGKLADSVLGLGFRRFSRVPVSRDELAEAIVDGSDGCCCEACSHEAALYALARFDIYPKADRNTADSSNGEEQ